MPCREDTCAWSNELAGRRYNGAGPIRLLRRRRQQCYTVSSIEGADGGMRRLSRTRVHRAR